MNNAAVIFSALKQLIVNAGGVTSTRRWFLMNTMQSILLCGTEMCAEDLGN